MEKVVRLEARKIRKPIMEKKRRQRINTSLEYLKRVLLQNTVAVPTNSGGRVAKLEKADILEMTVRYIQTLHKRLGVEGCEAKVTSTTQDPVEVYRNLISEISRPLRLKNGNLAREQVKVASEKKVIFVPMDKENIAPVTPRCNVKREMKEHWRPW